MNRYPETEHTFGQLLKKSFRLHYLTLRHTIYFVIAITLIKTIASFFMLYTRNPDLIDLITVAGALVSVYFFSAALLASHHAFIDKPISTLDAAKTTLKNMRRIYSAVFGYLIGAVIVIMLMRYVVIAIDHLFHNEILLHNFLVIIMIAVSALYVVMFSLAYPLVVIDNKSFFATFHESIVISEKNKFGIALLFVILGVVYTLVSPATVQEYFLTIYHLSAVFDLLVFCVFVPLAINILLMIIHDGKLKSVGELD